MKSRRFLLIAAVLAIGAMIVLAGCGQTQGGDTSETPEWKAMDALKSVAAEDITAVSYQRLTEGGIASDTVTDAVKIEDIYLRLMNVSIKDETEMGVDDDGLSITFECPDDNITFSFEGDVLLMEDGSRYEVENAGSLKKYIDSLAESEEETPEQGNNEGNSSTGTAYDISEGFEKKIDGTAAYLYFNDFVLIMPDSEKYSFEVAPDKQSVTFYLFSAQQEGYGGRLVTIMAFDLDDDSYTDIPSYHVAGVGGNVNKRFIAIYPTDVQWNGEDKTQDADYRDLEAYLEKIGEGAVNSPLQTADSNPAP